MLLLVPSILQTDSGEDGQDVSGLQDRDQGLRGVGVQQGVQRLQVPEVSKCGNEGSAVTGMTQFSIRK